jgi:predicted phosphodiesterase
MLIYVLHDLNRIDLDPETSGIRIIISGHTHKPAIIKQNGILYVNPGSAGPRRFRLPVSVALLTVTNKQVRAKIIELKV